MQIHLDASAFFDIIQRITEHSQRTQTQEIHLQKAKFLYMILVVFRHERSIGNLHRQIVRQRIARNHNTGRMC